MIRLLRQLEQRTGRRIHQLFDLVAGTSTGGILAVALALKHFTLEECEDIYRRARPCTVESTHVSKWPSSGCRCRQNSNRHTVITSGIVILA